jgi:hypothetical protein
MRKSLWMILAVLFLAIGAPISRADSITDYTLSFTLTDGSPNAASGGAVIFNNTAGVISPFEVDWNGVTFDFSEVAISDLSLTGLWSGCTVPDGMTCGVDELSNFAFANEGVTDVVQVGSNAPSASANAVALGTYQLIAVAAPEPGSAAFMLTGVGLVLVMRKRLALRHPQYT